MEQGYIHLWRKTLNTGLLRNHRLWVFWSWCLLKASYKNHNQTIGFKEISLTPGQFIFGRKKAAEELKMTEANIRKCIESLKTQEKVTIKTTNKFSIITICNWDIYQSSPDKNSQQTNKQLTNNKPTTNHKQEYNNSNNSYKKKSIEKKKYGSFKQRVKLTDDEYKRLIVDFGEKKTLEFIDRVDEYCAIHGKTYKDYNLTIRNWIRRDEEKIKYNKPKPKMLTHDEENE